MEIRLWKKFHIKFYCKYSVLCVHSIHIMLLFTMYSLTLRLCVYARRFNVNEMILLYKDFKSIKEHHVNSM